MNNLKRVLFAFLVVSVFCALPLSAGEAAVPKNIILFIGDGMGVSQLTAAKIVQGNLHLERFKTLGLLTTHSGDALITDSAAAGTALATGHKTYNGAISLSSDGTPLKTAVEWAEEKGKQTGVVVSCSVTHATPAAFLAHVASRKEDGRIAEQIASSGIEVLFGGGWAYFVPGSMDGSKRQDDKNLLVEMRKRMTVIRTPEEFLALGGVHSVAGLFAPEHPPSAREREPKLAELTRKAVEILSRSGDGFFLMVEGSQIDWASHSNDQARLISETTDFDQAVGVGLDFAQNDSRTLVIVTSDHETGGFAVHGGSVKEKMISHSRFTGKDHTATMVPLFAYGPGSSAFAGIVDNTLIGKTIINYLMGADR